MSNLIRISGPDGGVLKYVYLVNYDDLRQYPTKDSAVRETYLPMDFRRGSKKQGVKCWEDVYKAIGVDFNGIAPFEVKDGFRYVRRLRPSEIRMSENSVKYINTIISGQYRRVNNIYIPTAVMFDMMNYSPVDDNSVPDGELHIVVDPTVEWTEQVDVKIKESE